MQKAVVVNGNENPSILNNYLGDGWKFVNAVPFRPSFGGDAHQYTPGTMLVIIERSDK